jgi:hypothetical protein
VTTDLLRLELETLWETDGAGRLVATRSRVVSAAPVLVVAAGQGALVWETSAEVGPAERDALAACLERRGVAASAPAPGWAPALADELIAELAARRPVRPAVGGPSYLFDRPLEAPAGFELRSSTDRDADEVTARLPAADRDLTAPWVIALITDEPAAVCMTARSTLRAVEPGVWTYEPHRRQRLGAALTAAWSSLVADRTAFYSTGWDNVASQGVARRLGLRPIGQWWQVYPG